MRKIFLTTFLTIAMIAATYVPLIANTLSSTDTAYAQFGGPTGGGQTGDPTGGGQTGGPTGGGQTGGPTGGGQTGGPTGGGQSSNNCDPSYQLCNPLLSKYDTLCKVLQGGITLITQIGAMIAVLFIIWTGFLFVTAQGNPAKVTAAKNNFKTAIIGTALLLGASGIAQIVVRTVMTITNKDNPGICSI